MTIEKKYIDQFINDNIDKFIDKSISSCINQLTGSSELGAQGPALTKQVTKIIQVINQFIK